MSTRIYRGFLFLSGYMADALHMVQCFRPYVLKQAEAKMDAFIRNCVADGMTEDYAYSLWLDRRFKVARTQEFNFHLTPGWLDINYGRVTRLAVISACFFGSTGSFRRALTETNTYVTTKTSRTLFKSSAQGTGNISGVSSPTAEYFQNSDAIITFTTENELASLIVDVPQQRPMVFQVPKGNVHPGTSASMIYLFPGKTDLVIFEGAGDDYALHFFQFVPFLFARPDT